MNINMNKLSPAQLEALARMGDTEAQDLLTKQCMQFAEDHMRLCKYMHLSHSEALRELKK